MKKIIIATRGSQLALWQAKHVAKCLQALLPDLHVDFQIIKTQGDRILDVPLAKVGGKGLFVKEIEESLLANKADIAVHSMKDVPMMLPDGLVMAAILKRASANDLFLSHTYENLKALPEGSSIGTSSLRRKAQVLSLRPDLRIENLRGNVDTRMRKLAEGQFDAIIMAKAGIDRLNLACPFMHSFSLKEFIPAVGQGALGIECRSDREDLLSLLQKLNHPKSQICVNAERAFLRTLNGSCQVPIGAYAQFISESKISLEGFVADCEGKTILRDTMQLEIGQDTDKLGNRLAMHLIAKGADTLLEEVFCKENTHSK